MRIHLAMVTALAVSCVATWAMAQSDSTPPPADYVILVAPPAASQPAGIGLLPRPPEGQPRLVVRPATGPDDGDEPLPPGAVAVLGGLRLRVPTGSLLHPMGGILCDVTADMRLLTCRRNKARVLQLPDGQGLVTLVGPEGDRLWGRFMPDGKAVVLVGQGSLHVCAIPSGRYRAFLSTGRAEVRAVAASPDGKLLAAAVEDRLLIWRLSDGRLTAIVRGKAVLDDLAFSTDGERIITGWRDGTVRIWPVAENGARAVVLTAGSETGRGGADTWVWPSPDGTKLAVSFYTRIEEGDYPTKYVVVYDLASRRRLYSFSHAKYVRFTPDGTNVITVDRYSGVNVYDAKDGKRQVRLEHEDPGLVAPDGTVIEHWGDGLRLIDWQTRQVIRQTPGHHDEIARLAFSPDGKLLATAGRDTSARVWDLARNAEVHVLGHRDGVYAVRFLPDGKTLLTATRGWRSQVVRWDVATGKALGEPVACGDVRAMDFAPDGGAVATSGSNSAPVVKDLATGKNIASIAERNDAYWQIAFSGDGKVVAGAAARDGLQLWSAERTGRIRVLKSDVPGALEEVNTVALSPGGKYVAGGIYNQVLVWNARTGELLYRLKTRCSTADPLAFCPKGRYLATPAGVLWDMRTGQQAGTLEIDHPITSFAFDPSGQRLATGHADGLVILWDLQRVLNEPANELPRSRSQ